MKLMNGDRVRIRIPNPKNWETETFTMVNGKTGRVKEANNKTEVEQFCGKRISYVVRFDERIPAPEGSTRSSIIEFWFEPDELEIV